MPEGFENMPIEAKLLLMLIEQTADTYVQLHSVFLNDPSPNNMKAMLDVYIELHKIITDMSKSSNASQKEINAVTTMMVHDAFIRTSVKINPPDPTTPSMN